MKKIDTSPTATGELLPFYANRLGSATPLTGLDFVQQALMDMAQSNALALTSNANVISGSVAMILWGCTISVVSSNYVISAGAVYYNGEVFLVPGNTAGASSSTYIHASWVANPTDGTTKTIMSNGTQVSVHNQRTITFTANNTNTPGNLPDFGSWVNIDYYTAPSPIAVASFGTGFSASGNGLYYWKDQKGFLYVQGDVSLGTYSAGTVTTLPSGYRPTNAGYGFWANTVSTESGLVSLSNSGALIIHGATTASNSSLVQISFPPLILAP